MQTQISHDYSETALGKLANNVLRSCVHCGFCNATCPTYQLLGDELDGPRGRIYLIKQVMEGQEATYKTKQHLDRCLNCLNCETTCPSGVKYHHLLEVGQKVVNQQVKLPIFKQALRKIIIEVMPYPKRFNFVIKLGLIFKPILPNKMARLLPQSSATKLPQALAGQVHLKAPLKRQMLLLGGCVHKSISPSLHEHTTHIFKQLGIDLVAEEKPKCCGALTHHLQADDKTEHFILSNIDSWNTQIEQGIEAIISNASGCGVMVKDYPHYIEQKFGKESAYFEKAERVASVTKDVSEILSQEDLTQLNLIPEYASVSYHPPCTLQHGQRLPEIVEKLLENKGVELMPIKDKHLCCGSAGTYSLFNPKISHQLRDNKLSNLEAHDADVIATANIGCLHHLQSASKIPVIHWIQLFK